MTETFCTSGAVILKAGKNMSSDISGAAITLFINEAESFINNATRINYLSTFANLTSGAKLILEEVSSCLAAMYAIQYDMSGYTSRYEAETMLDVLRDRANAGIELLKDKSTTDYIDRN